MSTSDWEPHMWSGKTRCIYFYYLNYTNMSSQVSLRNRIFVYQYAVVRFIH